MATDSDQLAAIVRQGDQDRYLSALYAPEAKRFHLLALYAFNVEIAAIRDRIREPLAGEIRLQWWRDALAAGNGASGHPVADALKAAMNEAGLPLATFDNLLEARLFDLYDDPMPARGDLEGYLGETSSALVQMAAVILDPDEAHGVAEPAGHAGCAQGIAGLLRQLPIDRARGQCFVPAEILAASGVSRDGFLADDTPPHSAAAVRAMAALGREHLAAFEARAGSIGPRLRPAFLPLALTGAYLLSVEADPAAAMKRPADVSVFRRHWLLLRRAVRGWR